MVVGANGTEQTVLVTLGVQGTTDDQILSGLTLGEKVLTSPRRRAPAPATPASRSAAAASAAGSAAASAAAAGMTAAAAGG